MFDCNISVVVAVRNMEKEISGVLSRIRTHLHQNFKGYEIVAVDDNSSDKTASVLDKIGQSALDIRAITTSPESGDAVKRGVLSTKYEIVLMLDADLTTQVSEVDKHVGEIASGEVDVLAGSRYAEGAIVMFSPPWYRTAMEGLYEAFAGTVIFNSASDTQCGFRVMRGEAAREIYKRCRLRGRGLRAESLYAAKTLGYKIKEAPVTWFYSPRPFAELLPVPLVILRDAFMFALHRVTGSYKA